MVIPALRPCGKKRDTLRIVQIHACRPRSHEAGDCAPPDQSSRRKTAFPAWENHALMCRTTSWALAAFFTLSPWTATVASTAGLTHCASVVKSQVAATASKLMATYEIPGVAIGVLACGRYQVFNYGVESTSTHAAVSAETLLKSVPSARRSRPRWRLTRRSTAICRSTTRRANSCRLCVAAVSAT